MKLFTFTLLPIQLFGLYTHTPRRPVLVSADSKSGSEVVIASGDGPQAEKQNNNNNFFMREEKVPANSRPATKNALHHGTWIYGKDKLDAADIVAFARERDVNEVYVSLPALTAPLLRALLDAQLRVEALIDARDPDALIARAKSLGAQGIHYDYEPWIGKGEDTTWVDALVPVYAHARAVAAKNGMSFAADISAPKFVHLSGDQRRALLTAAARLVLMDYDVPLERMRARCENALQTDGGTLMIAARTCAPFLRDLDRTFATFPRYAGWAAFSYNQRCR